LTVSSVFRIDSETPLGKAGFKHYALKLEGVFLRVG